MAFLNHFSWQKNSSTDQEINRLLGHDIIKAIKMDKQSGVRTLSQAYVLVLHVIVFVLFSRQLGFVELANNKSDLTQHNSWSPVQGFVGYEVRKPKASSYGKHDVLGGPPTEEQDNAWDHLVNGSFFNASLDEFLRAGESLENLVELTDGGFLASIGVYHELHCIRQLRLYVYKDIYYPRLNNAENWYLQDHLDHCLEALRQTIMCNGNTAVTSFYWRSPQSKSPEPRTNAYSVCAKWDTIESWAYSRKVPVDPEYKRSSSE
ncbi:hypothetical protein F5B17DRAFT_426584 [Nemania serpens]|nr:hypothetical protein F5B17DRAFT_426584 [Nemania serpens]